MKTRTYRQSEHGPLTVDVFQPEGFDPVSDPPRAAAMFFFGGGWVSGGTGQFHPQCQRLTDRGLVTLAVQYRTENSHGTTPFDAVQDAVAAVRWARQHAEELGVDDARLAVGGGSAGAHLAAVTATLQGEGLTLDPEHGHQPDTHPVHGFRPDALLLYNPVYDNGPDGYGNDRLGERWEQVSPMHNLHAAMPPTLTMLGDQDPLVPVSTAERFRDTMIQLGVRSELAVYPGQPHGFFNPGREPDGDAMFEATLAEVERFLDSLGWFESPTS